jgi:hypothetical protein
VAIVAIWVGPGPTVIISPAFGTSDAFSVANIDSTPGNPLPFPCQNVAGRMRYEASLPLPSLEDHPSVRLVWPTNCTLQLTVPSDICENPIQFFDGVSYRSVAGMSPMPPPLSRMGLTLAIWNHEATCPSNASLGVSVSRYKMHI